MAQINSEETTSPKPESNAGAEVGSPSNDGSSLDVFMATAGQAAVDLSPLITKEIETRKLDHDIALVALLLYAANYARQGGASLAEFLSATEQAFVQAEELFASKPTEVLQAARKLIERGWCQGSLAMKWMKDRSRPEGKRLMGCYVSDTYASRWSLLGAIDAASDANSNRLAAREAVLAAVHESGFKFEPGSLTVTVLSDYNDVGWAPPLPELKLPDPPPEGASDEAKASHAQLVEDMKHRYETVTKPQWPKPVTPGRTKEEVLAVLDRAIALSGSGVAGGG